MLLLQDCRISTFINPKTTCSSTEIQHTAEGLGTKVVRNGNDKIYFFKKRNYDF